MQDTQQRSISDDEEGSVATQVLPKTPETVVSRKRPFPSSLPSSSPLDSSPDVPQGRAAKMSKIPRLSYDALRRIIERDSSPSDIEDDSPCARKQQTERSLEESRSSLFRQGNSKG
ncbi:hypothetical protein H1R20_g15084, partial [Candolleomyces eurysporus]